MDIHQITEMLRTTMDPTQRQQAEEKLNQINKTVGFSPALLQLVMMNDVDMPTRQAGAIYMKNLLTKSWTNRQGVPDQAQSFSILEQDRSMIRDSIVDAVVYAPDLIRSQLLVCVKVILKNDFPSRSGQIVAKMANYLQNPESTKWAGTLLCLYQLVKNFQYKSPEDREQLDETMQLLLPIIYQMCVRLLSDHAEESILLQKQIFKIFFAYTEYWLALKYFTQEVFSLWMEVFRAVVDRPILEQIHAVNTKEQMNQSVWKCKKWALRILLRMFEKYGSPSNVSKEYKGFAGWYLKTFSAAIVKVLIKILDEYKTKIYVSPVVLQHTLNYLNEAVGHAYSWRYLKPYMLDIVQNVLFPLLSYSDADEELWESDPYEYIKVKFDLLEDYMTPVMAAQSLLQLCCKKRKGVLERTMGFVNNVLTSPHADPRQKDGALHMIGHLADVLLTKKKYKDQMNNVLTEFVFPQFASPRGHMRARACWMIQRCSEMRFKPVKILEEAVRLTSNALLTDRDLPVKVQAAIALKMILKEQEKSEKYLEQNISQITQEILLIIRETKNDGMASVLQEIVNAFPEHLKPVADNICQHLATTFTQMLESSDDKAVSAIGLVNTIDTLLTVMEDHPEIMARLEPPALSVIGSIFTQGVSDLYEEALFLVDDLTAKRVSPNMWKVLELLYQVFQRDAFDYFADMLAALHNYVTVDTDTFLSNENYMMMIFNMCQSVLTGNLEDDSESHAAKLLEVIILQCNNRIDQCIPSFVELVVQRLNRGVKSAELRTMCLQVAIAALCYNPQLFFATMENLQKSIPSTEPIVSQFIKQWIHDIRNFLGIHDRKVCVLGLCTLLSLPGPRPVALNECAAKIIPAIITIFQGLKRAREAKALDGDEDDDDEDDEEDLVEHMEQDVLSSDESDMDDAKQEYLEKLQGMTKETKSFGRRSADIFREDCRNSELYEETDLESYTTPLDDKNCDVDEYIIFKGVLLNIHTNDPVWYDVLVGNLTEKERNALEEVMVLAEKRKAAADSKMIEKSGGYAFPQHTVPPAFNFGCTSGDQPRVNDLYVFDVRPKEV